MIAVAMMDVKFRENIEDEWTNRKIAYVFSDMSDIDSVTKEFKKGWNQLLNEYKMKGNKMILKFKKMDPSASIPRYAHEGDSGMDITTTEGMYLDRNTYYKFRTGIAAEIPEGYELQVRPRSGLAAKHGVRAVFGTVDSGYRGEIGVTLFTSNEPIEIHKGDRIAQLVLSPVIRADIEETDALTDTERGKDGFGSTGR